MLERFVSRNGTPVADTAAIQREAEKLIDRTTRPASQIQLNALKQQRDQLTHRLEARRKDLEGLTSIQRRLKQQVSQLEAAKKTLIEAGPEGGQVQNVDHKLERYRGEANGIESEIKRCSAIIDGTAKLLSELDTRELDRAAKLDKAIADIDHV